MPQAARNDLVDIAANPVPDGARCGMLRAADGVMLRFAQWAPSQGPQRGTLLLIQGRAEFIEKYFETVGHFRARGFGVISFDWRGQGGSQRLTRNPRKGHVDSFLDYELDLDAVLAAMEGLPKPWFVLAHSMGAAILVRRLGRGALPIERAGLTAPMLGLAVNMAPFYARIAADVLSLFGAGRMFVPGGGPRSISMKPFDNNRLSNDLGRYQRNAAVLTAAPDLAIGDPTVAWLAGAFRLMKAATEPGLAPALTTPLLVLASGADRVVSTHVTERFASRLKTGPAVVINGARHELLMEADLYRDQALAAIDAFLPGGGRFEREAPLAATLTD